MEEREDARSMLHQNWRGKGQRGRDRKETLRSVRWESVSTTKITLEAFTHRMHLLVSLKNIYIF